MSVSQVGGLFISFEGIDGAGKSTQIDRLAQAFEHVGRSVVMTREPGGTPLAESIRDLVLRQDMDALTEALLMFAARRDHLKGVIEPALRQGSVVLCDRFTDATFAYQGGGRGYDWGVLKQLEALVQTFDASVARDGALLQPDLTIWFDLDPATAAVRLGAARVPDRFESQPAAFFEAVRAGYARRAQSDPDRFARINADHERAEVWQQVCVVLQQRGWL